MKQKLVIIWPFSDGCTYSVDVPTPFLAKSLEDALFEFELACEKTTKDEFGYIKKFMFAGVEFHRSDFIVKEQYYPPVILTVDDWFKEVK